MFCWFFCFLACSPGLYDPCKIAVDAVVIAAEVVSGVVPGAAPTEDDTTIVTVETAHWNSYVGIVSDHYMEKKLDFADFSEILRTSKCCNFVENYPFRKFRHALKGA